MANAVTIPVVKPGRLGLNKQDADVIQPIGWATEAVNCVFSKNGALASRKGYQHVNDTSVSAEVVRTHTYIDGSGNEVLLYSTPTTLGKIVAGTATDITGTATTPTAGYWKFQNFNGKCVAWQDNHTPIVLDDTSDTWADLTGTAIPDGVDVIAENGYLFVLDPDTQTLYWSDLLIYNDFSGGVAGSADLLQYWPSRDTPVGMAIHNGYLLIFGKDNILVYDSPEDPSSLALVETIKGAGLVGRDAHCATPTDYAFLSKRGVHTFGRVVQEKSMPVQLAVPQCADYISTIIQGASSADNLQMVFSQEDNSAYFTSGEQFLVFDLTDQEVGGRVLEWDFVPNCMHEHNRILYYGVTNYVAQRTGYLDGVAEDDTGGSTYLWNFESAWHNLEDFDPDLSSRLKILKRVGARVIGGSNTAFTLKWYLDFKDNIMSRSMNLKNSGVSEYGVTKAIEGEFGSDPSVAQIRTGLSGTGVVIKFGATAVVNSNEFSMRAWNLSLKLGRYEL